VCICLGLARLSIAEQEALQKDVKSEEHDVERALAISLAGLLTETARDQQDSSYPATSDSTSRPGSTHHNRSTTAGNQSNFKVSKILSQSSGILCQWFGVRVSAAREEKRDAGPDPSEVEQRRKLLREQRDKIIKQKRQEREMQMQLHENQAGLGSRPKSGSVARAALAGQTAQQVDDKTLQYRRLLLQKIQEEVKNPELSRKDSWIHYKFLSAISYGSHSYCTSVLINRKESEKRFKMSENKIPINPPMNLSRTQEYQMIDVIIICIQARNKSVCSCDPPPAGISDKIQTLRYLNSLWFKFNTFQW